MKAENSSKKKKKRKSKKLIFFDKVTLYRQKEEDKGKTYSFMYGFYVNIFALVKNCDKFIDIDLVDISIYYAIKSYIEFKNSSNSNSKSEWVQIYEEKILTDLPILPFNDTSSVFKRINKLVACGLIEKKEDNEFTRKKCVRLGVNSELLEYHSS